MRWQYHKLTSGAAIYAVTGGYIPTCMAMIGSIIPDLMEMKIIRHRTATHWPLPWIILALVSYETCRLSPNVWIYIFTFICIGALLHLGEDYLSVTGIPFRSPVSIRKAWRLKCWITGFESLPLPIRLPLSSRTARIAGVSRTRISSTKK